MDSLTTYYSSIDEMPIYNWFKCNKGELKYVVKEGKEVDEIKCHEAFKAIYDEYLKTFGVGDRYEEYLKVQLRITEYNCDFVITGNRKILNKIDQLEERLRNMEMNNGESATPEKVIMYLSKWLGFHIPQKETTVSEYFTWIEEYRKQSKP